MNATPTPGPRRHLLRGSQHAAYLDCLAAESVPPRQRPYYATRVNQFIGAADGRNPSTLDESAIGELLAALGRRPDLADWQFAQLIDAVRIYLVGCLKLAPARRIDWAW